MASATPGEVKRVLESIGQKPRMLDTDLGNELKGELQPYLKEKQIAHRTKDPKDLNALATCDQHANGELTAQGGCGHQRVSFRSLDGQGPGKYGGQ